MIRVLIHDVAGLARPEHFDRHAVLLQHRCQFAHLSDVSGGAILKPADAFAAGMASSGTREPVRKGKMVIEPAQDVITRV
ncbi:MAG TPA: hypothetical protein VH575_06175, partial [Gemmataceae bacterium]